MKIGFSRTILLLVILSIIAGITSIFLLNSFSPISSWSSIILILLTSISLLLASLGAIITFLTARSINKEYTIVLNQTLKELSDVQSPASYTDVTAKVSPDTLLLIQIKNEVKSVAKEVEKAQDTIEKSQAEIEITKDVSVNIDEILQVARINPSTALLLLSTKIEEQMSLRLQEAGLQLRTNYGLSRQTIDMAVKEGVIPADVVFAFRDFLAVRNKVAHGAAFDVEEATILSLVSIGIELLKIISAKEGSDPELSSSDMT